MQTWKTLCEPITKLVACHERLSVSVRVFFFFNSDQLNKNRHRFLQVFVDFVSWVMSQLTGKRLGYGINRDSLKKKTGNSFPQSEAADI